MKYRAFIKKNMEKPARDSVFRRILRGGRPPLDRGALRRLLSALLLLSVLANSFGFAMDDFAVADALHVEQEDVGGAEEEIASDTDPAATEVNTFALGKVSEHQDEDDGYVYELAGAKKVLFSAIFDRVKLPVLLESVEIVRPLDKLDAAAMEKERADLKKRIAERKEQEKKNKPEEPEKESSKKKDKKDKKEEKTVFLSVLAKDGDFEITVLKDFSEAGLAVHTADDVLFIKLTNRIASMVDSTAAELDDYVLGDAYAGSSSDQAPADDASAYAFELGDASVALSEIIARTGMPVALADIELVGQSGSAGEGELLAIEPTEDDYRISAQADFDEARLEVYTAQDEYVVRLTDGRVAAAPEATEETPETSEPASDETSDTADAEPEAGESEPASDEASDTADAEPEAGESEPGTETDEEPTGFEIEEGTGEETATDTEEEQTEVEIDDEKPTSVENEEQAEVEDSPAQDADETEASRNAADPSLIVIGPSEGAKAPGADAQEGDDDASVAEANAAQQSTASHDTANLHLSLSGDAAATVSLRATEVETADHQRLVEAYNIESSRDCEGVAVALARLPHMAEGEYLALYGIAGGALSESPALDHLEVGDSHTFAVDAWEGFALVKLGLSVYQLIPAEPVDDATIELRGTMPVGASMEVESASGYGDAGDDVLMACDITIQDVEGADFQPLSGDPVEVTVRSDAIRQALFSGSELEVYSYSNGEENPEDVEIVRAVGNSVTFAAETFDTVYAIREVVLEKSLTASDGNTYHISVAYDTASGLPANAELAVQEITESDPAYADYVAQSAAKVGGEAKDVAFARAFDITLLDPDTGREYQPNKDVKVSITLLNEAMDEAQIDVVHFGKEAELMDSSVSGETVEFMTDGFSVYVVVSTVLEKKLTASDGNEYLVTVTYDTTCGIPAGAELIVSEIREGDAGYDAYMAASAEKLSETPENLALARAFDIALRNPETGEEYQPNKDVTVSIRLLKENLSDYENIDVVHFPGEADGGADVMDTTLKGETIEFETDGFSVYVLTGVFTYTYVFYVPSSSVTETTTDTGFKVTNWASCYQQLPVQTDIGNTYAQTVKNGETPIVPQLSDAEDRLFAGWFEGSYSGTDVNFGKKAYDFDGVKITENRTINLYARYNSFAAVVFHDQFNSSLNDYPVMFTRRGELVNGSAIVQISDVSATYSGDGELAFYGWSKTPVRTPGEPATRVDPDVSGCITITGKTDLYPIFQPFHWLSFYSAYTGSGATFIPQGAYFYNDGPTALTVPEWDGHTFNGWFNGNLEVIDNGDGTTTDKVSYSTKITNSDGSLISGVEGTGVKVYNGKLTLSADTTLYAKWDDATTVTYKIIIWKQKSTDAANLENEAKTYDFYESIIKTVPTESMAVINEEYKQYVTSKPQEFGNYTCRFDQDTVVNPKGYTVLNVYYDRNTDYTQSEGNHKLTFVNSADDSVIKEYESMTYGTNLLTGNEGESFVPADPQRENYEFTGWFADKNLTTQVFFSQATLDAAKADPENYNQKVLYEKMPDKDLTIYAGWSAEWYIVQIDPNYGTFNGNGSTWFWESIDGDLIQEYTQVTRDYVPSSSGTYYYAKHDRAFYGYSGNEWDNNEKDRDAFYTEDPSKATEDTTFEYAPGVYTYAGWYEVHADGTETPYDFSKHVDHDMILRLHWKKNGLYYVVYDPGIGFLSGSQDAGVYADQVGVLISCSATAPNDYVFEGWQVQGDASGHIYRIGDAFLLSSDYAVTVGGKNTVYLNAVYTKVSTAKIIYDPNGGTISGTTENMDFGSPTDTSAPTPVKTITDGKAIISNLVNNSSFTLSDGKLLDDSGFAFKRNDDLGNGMTLAGWSTEADYKPGDPFYELGQTYGVDSKEPVELYAVWKVKVSYHLNTESTTAGWGGDWTGKGYTYNDTEKTYEQAVFLGNATSEPTYIPTDTGDDAFLYWMTEPTGDAAYPFSTAVTGDLNLYAKWGSNHVTPYAVDASEADLKEKGSDDRWTVNDIVIGENPVSLTETSHVQAPSNYTYAFAAVSKDRDSIFENNAITNVFYNTSDRQLYVTYTGGEKAPLGDNNIYFVYYQKKSLSISYRSMNSAGVLEPASGNLSVDTNAPISTGIIGTYNNLAESVTRPKGWMNDNMLEYYSFAVGNSNAENASHFSVITTASGDDDNRPALYIRNTWRGFQYSTDGSNWVSCGYDPALYVVYYTQQPTIVMIEEKTVGTSSVIAEQHFDYQVVVKQTETDTTDSNNPVVTETNVFDGPYQLPDGEGKTAQSVILFYSNAGNKEITQTVTVTQTEKNGFATTVDAAGKGKVTENERKWCYTPGETVESPTVTFTNTQTALPVTVHVALIDISENTIVLNDNMRSATYSLMINPGEEKAFLTELPSDTVFSGDSSTYAFGAVLYGTDNGSIVQSSSMEVAKIAFAKVAGDQYELVLKDNKGKALTALDGYSVYYLYYPMPQIKYVKLSADEDTFAAIKGSLNGTSDTDTITYGYKTLTMNGAQVSQGQRFTIPMDGFRITQEVGNNTFRMPPILDDGVYARYLRYSKLGAGNADTISSITELGNDNTTSALTMHLQVQDNALKWSFTGEDDDWHAFTGTPTVYAIYEERGYDLQITKSVPVDVGDHASFTLTIESLAITKTEDKYSIEGYSGTPVITRASGSTPGSIKLSIEDGTSIKIIGLGQGSYTVTETRNDNYILTAKCGPINGTLEDETVTNGSLTISLDREKKLELANTHKAICKITVHGTEHPFNTLQSAVEYAKTNLSASSTINIEMLTDYTMPSSDVPVIPAGYKITLKTAETSGGTYVFDGGKSGMSSGATITRAEGFISGPMITNRGTLTLENLTLDGNNVEADSAMILSTGSVNISTGTLLMNAKNTTGNGGAICSTAGTVTVSATVRNNNAVCGGAIYSEGSSITITGTLSGNKAQNGGAIYYNGDGTISISGSAGILQNSATDGNGGAIYTTAGTIAVSGGSMTKNTAASGNGGAIYTVHGAVNVSGGTIGGTGNANSAINGSAAFIQSGSASFSGGSITANTATNGGAIGVGSTSVRLYFSGTASITGNTMSESASNVYLNHDTDAIINAEGLEDGAEIGIYVSGDMSADLFKNRGVPGAKFGVYSSETGITAFKNDRLAGITVTADTAARRLVWGKSIQVQVRYLEKFDSAFPQKSGGSWNGTQKPQNGWERSYYLPSNNNSASSIGDDLRSKYDLKLTKTAAFACAFVDDDTNDIAFEDYVTEVNWDSSENSWKFTKRGGTVVPGEKLVVYFSEPAYINIENNTSFPLTITELSLRGKTATTGYGYVFAVNGAVQDKLMPITAADLTLGAGKSLKLMFPGGVKSQVYTLKGGFVVGGSDDNIPVRQTGVSPSTTLSGPSRTDFTLNSGKTGNANGSTVDVVFGGSKPICKIVTTTVIDEVQDSEIAGIDNPDEDGVAYLFSSLQQAVTFAQSHSLTGAVIELLVDYLIPGADAVSIPANYNLTFTTAIGDTGNDYNYSNDSSARATISRDNSNTDSFIVVAAGQNSTKLTVTNLIFDGKNYSGNIAGGVIKTTDCEVEITNCDFKNCIAKDGGGIKIEYTPLSSNYTNAKLTVTGCNFTNCKSDGSLRQGGGAIWTNACSFTLTGEKDTNGNYTSGVFDSCVANDQGGAVFHRIDWAYPEEYRSHSTTTVQNCKFINCQAKAAGGLEIDSYSITTSDCWFENCQATTRNAGGFNVFIQYKVNEADDMNPPVSATGLTKLNVTNCTFKYCTANQHGGGFRTLSHETTLTDCIFIGNTAGSNYYGGGISITNQYATEGAIKGCTIQNCSARSGGGVYFDGSKNAEAKLTIMDDPDHNCESIISGNTASNQGGGVYTYSAITLINTKIQNNTLTNGTVNNAAGMYVSSKTLTIGKTGAEEDTTIITNNTVSGGGASNLHLWGGSNVESIVVNCDLSVGSHIGVTNPGSVTQQFGTSPNSTTSWRPYGLADPTPDDPDYYPTFVADDGSVYGIIDRSDETGKRIVWGGPPICKITDAGGNLLYLDGARKYPAIFDALEGGSNGSWSSAFALLRNPNLYRADGSAYPKDNKDYPYYVKMLIETYESTSQLKTIKGSTTRTIVLTTASNNDSKYPYRGTEGTSCTIIRGGTFKDPMLLVSCNVTLENIVLDGGSEKGLSSNKDGGLIQISDQGGIVCKLGEKAVLQNSSTSGYGGAVSVLWSDFMLSGGTIQNCVSSINGGAIYMASRTQSNPARGYLKLESGNILGCSANNGGGVYINTGTFTVTAVSIRDCVAKTNGGGICFMADGRDPTNSFTMSGGTISNCTATDGAGGGVYVNNGKTFNMSGGFIMGNSATTRGGGIAVGNNGATLNFSKTPWISGNSCEASVADEKACNVELSLARNTIINTNGIWNGARIGVYVTGAENNSSPYAGHGREGDPFGTFKNASDVSYLYGFVNDYNGLKGGLATGQNPNSNKNIYWIKIFSLEISNEVISYQNDDNEGFRFKVTLTGTASDGTVAEDIDSTPGEPEKYGGLYFTNGVATKMVVKEGETTRVVDLILKSGESVTGERLPAGLNYTVEELMTDDQKKTFAAMPDETIRGYIGEYAESTTRNRYLSTAEFTNLRPVCKVEGNSENMLYYKNTIKYNWYENSSPAVKQYDRYQPAVYATLEKAFEVINGGTPKLYFKGGNTYLEFTESSYHVEMLAPYTMQNAERVNSGKTITITTAGTSDPVFPYQGSGNVTIHRGNFDTDSMFTAEGSLILCDIVLDGKKNTYTVAADGGIVNIPGAGSLTVEPGAILRNSLTTGNGGAVFVGQEGTMTVTGGTINLNAVTGTGLGAGIYLAEGASLRLKGDPSFGGTGVYNDGSINSTTGNTQSNTSGVVRQDIYIAGYESADDENTSANSLVITGNITSGAGTIWVWAAESPRYKSLRQFAKYEADVTDTANSFAAFRNARADSDTGADLVGQYLYGITKANDTEKNVFWYGLVGFDVKFKKTDGFGDALAGAVFSLYTDPECRETEALKVSGTAVTGTADDNGVVIFNNKIPTGVYYLKETTVPSGYSNTNIYIVLVGDKALAKEGLNTAEEGYLGDITLKRITEQTSLYKTAYQDASSDYDKYAIFLMDPTTNKAVTAPDIARYGIMNQSTMSRKVILRKVLRQYGQYTPLKDMRFKIYRADGSEVVTTDRNDDGYYVSGDSGVYFIGTLNDGTYTLVELDASNVEHTFTLVVGDTMVRSLTEVSPGTGE